METDSYSFYNLDLGFARLQNIQWEQLGQGEQDETLTELMSQFVSRVRQWVKFLHSDQQHIFGNLATQIRPDMELPSSIMQWLEKLGNSGRIQPWRGRTYVIQGIYNYLCWCFLREINAVPQSNLPHPYEPFISFLERGGGIYVEHHYFMDIYANFVYFHLRIS
jgi:hypothetical protein